MRSLKREISYHNNNRCYHETEDFSVQFRVSWAVATFITKNLHHEITRQFL